MKQKERGHYFQARIARKSGGEVKKDTTSSRDKEKTATKLLSTKKEKKPVNPNYKPAKQVVRLVQNVIRLRTSKYISEECI